MRKTTKSPGEKIVTDIERATRKHYPSDEKIKMCWMVCAVRTALLSYAAVTHKWDLLVEGRYLRATDACLLEFGVWGVAYCHIDKNVKLGVGYNTSQFSDDLTDLTLGDEGVLINLIAKF